MPNYDYKCKDCEIVFTIEKSMNDSANPVCPKCNSAEVSRVWGKIQLKGCDKTSGTSSCGSNCTKSSCSGCSCN